MTKNQMSEAKSAVRQIIIDNLVGKSATSKQLIQLAVASRKSTSERLVRDTITLMRKAGELYVVAYTLQFVDSGDYQQLVPSYSIKTRSDQYDANRPKINKHERQRRYKSRKRIEQRAALKRTTFECEQQGDDHE